jgi:DNA-binding NarL/FixJ family response regulator
MAENAEGEQGARSHDYQHMHMTPVSGADISLGAQTTEPITVLLVDDARVVRDGLKMLFNLQQDLRIIGEAEDGAQAVRLAAELSPKVVVMDVNMPDMNGFAAAHQMRQHAPRSAVVLLSLNDSPVYRNFAQEVGARAFVPKTTTTDPLLAAVRNAAC